MKKQSAPAQSGPDAGPWVDLGNGRSRSASTGKMRYDPNADPAYRDAIKRIQAQEQAAAAKRALDALGAAATNSVSSNHRALDIVGSVVKGVFGHAGAAIGGCTGNYVGASMDAPEQPHKDATVMKNAQPFKPEQADGPWSPPRAVYQLINVRLPSLEETAQISQFFARVSRAGGRSA